ncbi:MAG: autotransporter domain-containing protein, partial [Elusimicrobia bacterium]|nr:autotransporter domain-containing protein [Elusimicrobiota bacterium]
MKIFRPGRIRAYLKRATAVTAALSVCAAPGFAGTYNVVNNFDSGDGSLRAQITAAASQNFNGTPLISWMSGGTISLLTDLPSVSSGTVLDVTNAPSAVALTGAGGLPITGLVTFKNGSGRDWSVSSAISGTGTLSKTGSGRLILSGANTYAGGTLLNEGTLNVNSDASLGAAAGALTFGGGTLQTAAGITATRSVVLNAGGGTLDLNAKNSTFSGVVSGSGLLTVGDTSGGGVLTLSGANTYSGGTTINGALGAGILAGAADVLGTGRVTLNSGAGHADLNLAGFNQTFGSLAGDANSTVELGAARLTVGADGTSTAYAGTLGDSRAGGSLVKTGAGTLTLSRANAFSGGTTVKGGEIGIDNLNELGSGAVTLDGGGLRTTAALSFSRDILLGAGGGALDSGANVSTFTGILSGAGLTKTGTGTLFLTGANTYTGGTTFNAGAVNVAAENNLGAAGGGLTFGGGTLQTAAALTDARAVTLNGGGGTLDAFGNASTFSGVIADGSAAGGLTVADSVGGGKIVLSGVNTYSGGTTFNSGILSAASDVNLGLATGGLTFNGGTLQTTAVFVTSRAVTLNGSGTIDTQAHATTLGGAIGGAGSLTQVGTGTLFLTGSNSYSGGTTIGAGTVNINNSAALGVGALTFAGAGTLQILEPLTLTSSVTLTASGSIDTVGNVSTLSGLISGAGSLTMVSSGTLNLTGVNTYSGGTTVLNAGVLGIGNGSALGTGTLTLNNATLQTIAPLTFANAVTLGAGGGTFDTNSFDAVAAGVIGGAGALTKIGAGTLTLGSANTFAGGTTVNGGVLQAGIDNALLTTKPLTVNAGGAFNLSTFAQTVDSYTGPGTLQLTMKATPTFNVTNAAALTGGTLKVGLTPQVVLEGATFTPIAYGSHVGTFASIASPAALSFTPTYNAGSLLLTAHLVPFANVAGTTGNQAAIGGGLEALRVNPTGDQATVIGNLYTMDAPTLRAALDQIGPVSLASMRGVGLAASGAQSSAVARRVTALADGEAAKSEYASYSVSRPSPYPGTLIAYDSTDLGALDLGSEGGSHSRWGFFTSGVVTTGRVAEATSVSGTQPGYATNTGGLTGGADYRFDDHFAAGVSAGYLHGHAGINAPAAGTVDNNSARLGVYGTGFTDNFRANLYVGGAADFYKTNRSILFGNVARNATAAPTGTEFNTNAGVSYDVAVPEYGIVSPFGGFNYDRLMIGRFTETGADALNLAVSPQTAQSLQSTVGLRFSNVFKGENGFFWRPFVSVGWRHEFLTQSRPIDAQLATGGGSGFAVMTGDVARDGTEIGAGTALTWRQTSLNLDYTGD